MKTWKLIALTLILTLIPITETFARPVQFVDIQKDFWSYDNIMLLSEKNVISGYPDNSFRPNSFIKRSEFAVLLANLTEENISEIEFSDVSKDDWYYSHLRKTSDFFGVGNYFRGNDYITREEAACAVGRAVSENVSTKENKFNDTVSLSDESKKYISFLSEQNVLSGYPDGSFAPYKKITRAEASSIFTRAFKDKLNTEVSEVSDTSYTQSASLTDFLKTALEPVGSTMYVWGGGWNEADTAAGPDAKTIGISPRWKDFYSSQDSSYNYNNYLYQIRDGLDCSGFVGWSIFNIFPNDSGYVMKSTKMSEAFASYGWGDFTPRGNFSNRKAGDILSTTGHVWISLGDCNDGSSVILHASPPGVMINGTASGANKSEAVALAEHYMGKYYPEWLSKYPDCTRGNSYLTNFDRFRWSDDVLPDPDGLKNMSANDVLAVLFNEK